MEQTVRYAVFNTVSMMTTTGYANADFDLWEAGAKHVLLICMFIGGMAGSTTCSIKTLRWLVVIKGFRRDLFTAIHPEGDPAGSPERRSGRRGHPPRHLRVHAREPAAVRGGDGLRRRRRRARVGLEISEFDAMGAAGATFFNIGPGFGIAGPFGTYEGFPVTTKLLMIVLMWVGRIEIVPVLVLFTRGFWRS